MFTNSYLVALGIPAILLFSGAFARKLVRGSKWQRSDFFLGVEFTLAAMSAALVNVFDLTREGSKGAQLAVASRIEASTTFLALCFFLLLWVLSVHQDWERRNQNSAGQLFWLAFVSNLVGAGLLAVFVLLIKGVGAQ